MSIKKESLVFCYWDDVWDIPTHSPDKEVIVNLILEEDENEYTSSTDS